MSDKLPNKLKKAIRDTIEARNAAAAQQAQEREEARRAHEAAMAQQQLDAAMQTIADLYEASEDLPSAVLPVTDDGEIDLDRFNPNQLTEITESVKLLIAGTSVVPETQYVAVLNENQRLTAQVTDLTNQLAAAPVNTSPVLQDLQDELAQVRQDFTVAQSNLAAEKANAVTLNSSLASAHVENAQLRNELDAANAEIEQLEQPDDDSTSTLPPQGGRLGRIVSKAKSNLAQTQTHQP